MNKYGDKIRTSHICIKIKSHEENKRNKTR